MPKRRATTPKKRTLSNQRKNRLSLKGAVSSANRRAHEKANRRSGRRQMKSIQAAIAATDIQDDIDFITWPQRMLRWMMGLLLLPACGVKTWTLLSRFSHATVKQGFWQTPAFWYFATGCLLMIGWFWSGLLKSFFLYLYVLGHELTHVVFVWLCRGKVSGFHVSSEGGYIKTNKTNLLIALSPYFVPFWSVICAAIYASINIFYDIPSYCQLAFYAIMGITWAFHMVWTLWMIPRDQPDLRENGTFLSLIVIYLANLMVLVALLCAAENAPLRYASDFGMEWFRNAAITADVTIRWTNELIDTLSAYYRR